MSGHSHWAGIKHKKAAIDAKRGKLWSKLARIIIVAAKQGGPDPAQNLQLRYAIDKARAANMPKDTIEKAIKKGTGDIEGATYEEVSYEGYGPAGVAVMVEALTDNRNRTAPEIKKIFEKRNGSLGTNGCVSWMFEKKGLVTISTDTITEDELTEIALEAGADDMQNAGEVYEITCQPAAFDTMKKTLEEKNIKTLVAELSMVPQTTIQVSDLETAKKIVGLMEDLEEHDDTQNTYANFDIPDELLQKLS